MYFGISTHEKEYHKGPFTYTCKGALMHKKRKRKKENKKQKTKNKKQKKKKNTENWSPPPHSELKKF